MVRVSSIVVLIMVRVRSIRQNRTRPLWAGSRVRVRVRVRAKVPIIAQCGHHDSKRPISGCAEGCCEHHGDGCMRPRLRGCRLCQCET